MTKDGFHWVSFPQEKSKDIIVDSFTFYVGLN